MPEILELAKRLVHPANGRYFQLNEAMLLGETAGEYTITAFTQWFQEEKSFVKSNNMSNECYSLLNDEVEKFIKKDSDKKPESGNGEREREEI